MTDEGASEDGNPWEDPVARKVGIGCMTIVAIFAALFLWGMVAGDDEESGREALLLEAEWACEDFVERRLKAPSTADFNLSASGGPTSFTVSGSVDAANSFGAKLRHDVTCRISLDGDRWKLDSLTGME